MKKTSLIIVLFLVGSVAYAENYVEKFVCEIKRPGYVYSEEGELTDEINISSRSLMTLSRQKEGLQIQFEELTFNVEEKKLDRIPSSPHITGMPEAIQENMSAIRNMSILLKPNEIIVSLDDERTIRGGNYDDFVKQYFAPLDEPSKSDGLSAVLQYSAPSFPFVEVLPRLPLLIEVPDDIKIGDEIDIPFREIKESSFSPVERPHNLLCFKKENDSAVLTSNVKKKGRSRNFLTWHVRMEYDLNKQIVRKLTIKRLGSLRLHPEKDDTQVTVEEISLRPAQ